MKLLQIIVLFYCFFVQPAWSQDDDDYYKKTFFQFQNLTYKPNIRTVLLHHETSELLPPLIPLYGEEKLTLSFDDMESDYKTYNYTIIHCDADWEPTNISPSEYINGYRDDIISDYKYSFNTLKRYTHYKLTFPNQVLQITKSGNYIIKVYQDYNEENIVLSQRFMIVDEKIGVIPTIRAATRVSDRNYKQEIDFTLDHHGVKIGNPFSDIKVVITQNNRWDNAVRNLQPIFVNDEQLIYDYDDKNVFYGGNEFRYFDIKSLRFQSDRINTIKYDTSGYHVHLVNDEKRSFKRYYVNPDINGKFLVKIQEGRNSEVEADYTSVHFRLPFDNAITDGNLYVFGALSNWQCKNEFKMKYEPEQFAYTATALLKQGYYNYEYVFLKDGDSVADETVVEGTHWETENDYTIYVYLRSIGTNYDQLVAAKAINSIRKY